MLTAQNLKKCYGSQTLLNNVSIEVGPGEIVSILGPSGGGKSTLLRILSFLDAPDSGAVYFDSKNAAQFKKTRQQLWPQVTLVFQQQFLWPHLSVLQNISLACSVRTSVPTEERSALLERLELHALGSKRPWQLSQGERARTALARALLLQPKYLLLDEITAALDSVRAEVVGILLRRFADAGGGVLLVTHELGFASRWSDRSYRLEGGELQSTTLFKELSQVSNTTLATL